MKHLAEEVIAVSNPEHLTILTKEMSGNGKNIETIAARLHHQDGLKVLVKPIDGESLATTGEETWGKDCIKERAVYANWMQTKNHHAKEINYDHVYPRFVDTIDLQVTVKNAVLTRKVGAGDATKYIMVGGQLQSIINATIKEIFTVDGGTEVYTIKATQNNALGRAKMTAEHARFLCQTPDLPYFAAWEIINKINRGEYDSNYSGYDIEFMVTEVDCTRNAPGTLGDFDTVQKLSRTRCEVADIDIEKNVFCSPRYTHIENDEYNGLYSHTFVDNMYSDSETDDELEYMRYSRARKEHMEHSNPWHVRTKIYDKFKYNLEVKSVKGKIENSLEYIYNPEYHNLQRAYKCPTTHALGLSRLECTFRYLPTQKGIHFEAGKFETEYLDSQYAHMDLYLVKQSMQKGYQKVLDVNLRNSVILVRNEGSDTNVSVALIRAMNPTTGRCNGIAVNTKNKTGTDTFEKLARYCTIGSKPVDLYVVDKTTFEVYDETLNKYKTRTRCEVVGYAILPPDATHKASLNLVGKTRPSGAVLYKNKLLSWDRVGLPNAGNDFYVEPLLRTPRVGDIYSPDQLGQRVTKKSRKAEKDVVKKAQKRYQDRLNDLQKLVNEKIVDDDKRYKKWQDLKFVEKNCFIVGKIYRENRYGERYMLVAVSTKGKTYGLYSANAAMKRLVNLMETTGQPVLIETFRDTGETFKGFPIFDIEGRAVNVETEI